MNVMAEAHRRARYERNMQICIAHGVFSPPRIALGDVGAWREQAIRTLGPAPGTDSYATILAEELRYLHYRNSRIRRAA